ncbi:VirB8/TrbF family protein [Sphingobium sp. MK2]|uniref:virB8 family protein n=1 Tax=Sphingobium sp. MK2 TaxID=3116540 RepID=UPI0032E35D5B
MNKPNPGYFDLARNWADERDIANVRSRRIAWTIAVIAVALAALEAVALALAMPLKTVVPMAVLVDRTTGHVERVNLDQMNRLSSNSALQQSMLAQYVIARESYDPINIGASYRKVVLWSGWQARASYMMTMKQDPPSARLGKVGRSIGLEAQIKSISMLNPMSALVRFDVAKIGSDGRRDDIRPYIATILFGFRDKPMSMEDRLDNPLGFEVRSYRVSPEAISPADPVTTATSERQMP